MSESQFQRAFDGQKRLIEEGNRAGLAGSVSPLIEDMLREGFQAGLEPSNVVRARAAIAMAQDTMRNVDRHLRKDERTRRKQLGLLNNPNVAVLAASVPEGIFRPTDPTDQLLAMAEIVRGIGIPNDLDLYQQLGLMTSLSPAVGLSKRIDSFIMRIAKADVLREVGGFVKIYKDGSPGNIVSDLERSSKESGLGYEANLVTESARTEAEALKNLNWYKGALKAGAKSIAIKPTSIVPFSDGALARPVIKKRLVAAFAEIFEVADKHRLPDGQTAILTIDSERSDIFDMVGEAVIEAAKDFPGVRVQVAAQAYLHDTEARLVKPLMEASKRRVSDQGGEPHGIRLVNGANEEGEDVLQSSMAWLFGTPLVKDKAAAHANFMRLRKLTIDPLKDGNFTLTVGTMNMITLMDSLLELARAGVLASKNGGFVRFGMLKGMTGQEVFRELQEKYGIKGHEYTPVISLRVIVELFKYYLRRINELASKLKKIDKNTIANYLGITAKYGVNSPEWANTQVLNGVLRALHHHQNHLGALDPKICGYRGEHEPLIVPESLAEYRPVPSMAPGSYEDSSWIDSRIQNCENRTDADAETIKLDSSIRAEGSERGEDLVLKGPTRPDLKLASVELAGEADANKAFDVASNSKKAKEWAAKSVPERQQIMRVALEKLKEARGDLDEALMMNIGKAILEADEEVSEGMDFANLSRLHTDELAKRKNLKFVQEGDGVDLVICPKNFPQAIPLARIFARLLAGYRVIVKPSGGENEESILATYKMMECLWAAGIPKEALIFLPCNNKVASHVSKKAERAGFTGGTGTAKRILGGDGKEDPGNPKLDLTAETGGRNFIVIDSTTDLKAAATEVLKSFCGFAGQKCSKPIAVILTKDVNKEEFNRHLLGQLQEMLVDTALKRQVDVTPLSRQYPPDHPFYQKVMECLPGEEWMKGEIPTGILDEFGREIMREVSAQPKKMGDPGIRFIADAANFDFSKIEEIFAPIISVVQIDGNVKDAVEIINDLDGNLTGALLSQNREAILYAIDNWKTGNLYIGRGSTGAKAHQGFGDGVGDSHVGAHGAKTGTIEWQIMNSSFERVEGETPEYDKEVVLAANKKDRTGLVKVLQRLEGKAGLETAVHAGWSCLYEYERHYSKNRPAPYQTKGQYDWIKSHNVGDVLLRISEGDKMEDILCKIFATVAAGNDLSISAPESMKEEIEVYERLLGGKFENLFPNVNLLYETEDEMVQFIQDNADNASEESKIACILYSDREKISDEVARAAVEASVYIDGRKATGDGLVDMVTQFRQQSYCWVYHIGGNVDLEHAIQKQGRLRVPYASAA